MSKFIDEKVNLEIKYEINEERNFIKVQIFISNFDYTPLIYDKTIHLKNLEL